MRVFLTSSPCAPCLEEGIDIPCQLNEDNDFVENLRGGLFPGAKGLIISADPHNYELNDEMLDTFYTAFQYHGFELSDMILCDLRNAEHIEELITESDMIILGGGHVPTQNEFFHWIHLRELLQNYEGTVMGISAGSMNCADTVYAQPELPGESVDPDYERYLEGLGLTDYMILPHYQEVKDNMLDGKRLIEEITLPDSMGNRFYVLVDGSYILIQDQSARLYGEAYLIQDGYMEQICDWGNSISLD
ncbi:MAG: Type 1 glutamine amidotransferase-like domain-containing protein [Lachnospiraceae bacterium]|nr:Type 1 glutamine amidotransferase-like domain-containing protein [Lachnospiraceae bacterium]